MGRLFSLGAAILAMALLAGISLVSPPLSQAASYRYWTYWLGSEAGWSFSSLGPAFRTPADGSVEGWRFGVTAVVGDTPPRAAASFAAVCGDTPTEVGRKRVALIVDPGFAQDAPAGESGGSAWARCVVADIDATGFDIVTSQVSVRTQRGLICSLNGFPASECAVTLRDPDPQPTPTTPAPVPQLTASPSPVPEPTAVAPTDSAPSVSPNTPEVAIATNLPKTTPPNAPPNLTPAPNTTESPVIETADDTIVLAAGPSPAPGEELPASGWTAAMVIMATALLGGGAVVLARRRRLRRWNDHP